MSRRKPSAVMLAQLADFARAPIAARGEYADLDGFVLKTEIGHYDQRPFGAIQSRGWVEYFKRCGCLGPCSCVGNGYHITKAGREAFSVGRRS